MSERPLPGGRFLEATTVDGLRVMSPYAVVGRRVRVATVPEVAGKVCTVWAVHRKPGMVWVADGNHAYAANVTDLEIVVASPHLCGADDLCCDTCLTHLGCRCPELEVVIV